MARSVCLVQICVYLVGESALTRQYLDVLGLATYGASNDLTNRARAAFPAAVELDSVTARVSTLSKLRSGAGVQIITGPLGREFWSIVGLEVQVTVWPDDYDWSERWSEYLWAWVASGGDYEDGRALEASHIKKGKQPTSKHRLYEQHATAVEMATALSNARTAVEQEVVEDTPFEVVDSIELVDGMAIDFEWHRKTRQLVGMAVSGPEPEANQYTPLVASDYPADEARIEQVKRQFTNSVRGGLHAVGHGLRADLSVVYQGDPAREIAGETYHLDDTMGMAFLLGESRLGLKPLARKYLGRDPIENDREWADMPARMTARYAAAGDTRNTADLFKVFDKLLTGRQREIYEQIERPLVPIVASMEKFGVVVDIEATKRLYHQFRAIQYGLRHAVLDLYGHDIGTEDGQRSFVEAQGYSRPTSLDQRALALNPHWCIDLILEHNMARTRANNFLKKILVRWRDAGKPKEFRLYTRFNQFARDDDTNKLAPGTGRFSSSKNNSPPPNGASGDNLQNQPRDIRSIYRAPEGCVWWSFDYDSIEIRAAAALSRDPEMLKSLQPGEIGLHDRFQRFVNETYHANIARPAAKTGNFEQLYGGGWNQLIAILAKQRVFISRETAEQIVKGHHELFHTYHAWGADRIQLARSRGYAETYEGRRRWLPDLYSPDDGLRGVAERGAQNHDVQGTSADVIKRAMLRVQPVLRDYKMGHLALTVHDELDGWVWGGVDLTRFKREMEEAMEYEIEGVKLTVAGGIGATWAEAH